MQAPLCPVACICGADVVVVAVYRLTNADPSLANIVLCAGIVVATQNPIKWHIDTAMLWVARVLCAWILVIAVQRIYVLALPVVANIFTVTEVAIVAGGPCKPLVLTAHELLAVVPCAYIVIIARVYVRANALPLLAGIYPCARVIVRASSPVWKRCMHALSCDRVACIACARVVIIAQDNSACALPADAFIVLGAWVIVITSSSIRKQAVQAFSSLLVAIVFSAIVVVRTIFWSPSHTSPAYAMVLQGAGIFVITWQGVVRHIVTALCSVIAKVSGAWIVIIADKPFTDALSLCAPVIHCACILVVAQSPVGCPQIHTAYFRVARINGAHIVIVTIPWSARLAFPLRTHVLNRAHVAIFTTHLIV
jgi:hypothetical protein